jgi:hypothetical protein
MRILVIPISEKQWNSREFSSAVTDALDAGRRIEKKLDIKRERKRFSVACNRIEAIAMHSWYDGKIELDGDAANSLVEALSSDGGITYPFVAPSNLPELFKRLKNDVPASLRRIQGGIAVLLLPYMSPSYSHRVTMPAQSYGKPSNESQVLLPELDTKKVYLSNRQLAEIAHRQIQDAIVSNRPLNASSIPHEVFTEVIRGYLYRKNETISFWKRLNRRLAFMLGRWNPAPPVMLRIAYSDGSEGRPFPLLYPPEKTRSSNLSIIQVGLMSMRHSESLDPNVDIYLLRNKEIDNRDTFAEQDEAAYNKTLQFLANILNLGRGVELRLYHTGLEPAVVGAYRAIVETIHMHRGQLVVVPVFIRDNGYQMAESWF